MAGSRGIDNFNKNWRGQGNIPTRVKATSGAVYYDSPTTSRVAGRIPVNTEVIYRDDLTRDYNKVAVQVGDVVFYTGVDNLAKPASLSTVNLKPQAFGLAGTEYTLTGYLTALRNSIRSRTDINGDLQEYLLDLVQFAETGGTNITGYDIRSFPIRDIIKDFGEVIGPIYCVKRGLTSYNIGVNVSSKIFIPVAPNEPLLDYYINTANNSIKVSAKAVGTSNTLKVADLVPVVLQNQSLLQKYANSIEFQTMRAIHENSMVQGPIQACGILGIITPAAVSSVSANPIDVPDKTLFQNLISSDTRLQNNPNVTTKQVSFLCEKALIDYSKQTANSTKYTEIIRDVLRNEIYFVKLNISGGIPSFQVQATSGQTSVNNLYFRTKNGYDAKSDKLGFKL